MVADPARGHDEDMSESESSHKHGDVSMEPGGADEVAAAQGGRGGPAPATGKGVTLGQGEPSTFEPEEDPETLSDDAGR